MKLKKVQISDLGEIITGNTPPKANSEYYDNHTIFVKPTDINTNEKYTYVTEESYSELAYKKYIKSLIPKGSTCVVTIGSIGKKITKAHCDLFINQAMNAIVPNKNYDEDFIFYLLKFNLAKVKMVDSGTASGRENVSKSAFSKINLNVPSLNIQKKIGKLLSNYDDLIENNNKRIKLLENMAEELFKEWFVRLRFPNYQNTKIEDGIPQGWERVTVDSLLKQLKGTVKIKTSEMLTKGRFPVIDQSKDFIAGYTNEKDINYFEGIPFIVFGDHTRVLKLINFSFAKGADGVQVLVSNNERMPQLLFYHNLLNVDLSNFHYSRHLKFLKKEKVLLPTKKIANEFNSFTENLYKEIDLLRGKNQTLKQTRDLLLPRLLSGKLDIEKLDIN